MVTAQHLTFGALLKRCRRAAGLTQEALAAKAGYSTGYLSMLERGERVALPATVQILAEALGVSQEERAALLAAAEAAATTNAGGARAAATARVAQGAGVPPLVGRTHELEGVERLLAGQAPPVLLLVGEPGIGKTRMLQEAVARAHARGWPVLRGGCHRRSGQEPYAPLLEALGRDLEGRTPAQLRNDLQGCAWLVRLLPELRETGSVALPDATLAPEQERRLMFAAARRYLANIAGREGVLLALDDLQWASADALDLLAALVRAPGGAPLRVVGAYRDTDVRAADPLAVLLADLVREGRATQFELGPLALEEATSLLDRLLEGVVSARAAMSGRLVQRAGGVPFFLVSYVQGLRLGALEGSVSGTVPRNVAQTVRQRVVTLSDAAQDLLGVASVIGGRVPRHLLLALESELGRSEADLLDGLDAACQARILVEDGEDAYQFGHDLIRSVVRADLGTARRAALHRRVAETLERGPGEQPLEMLAYHFGQAGETEKAVIYLERAGDRAQTMRAHAAAEGYYRELAERLDQLGRAAQAAGAREKLGVLLKSVARYQEALQTLERAAEGYRAVGEHEGWARATAQVASTHARSGTPEDGRACLRPLLDTPEAEGLSDHCLALVYTTLAQLSRISGRYTEELRAAERAATYARAGGETQLLASAEEHRGCALLMLSRHAEAVPALEEAVRLAEAVSDLNCLSYALNEVAAVYDVSGDLDRYRSYVARALDVAERLGDPTAIALMLNNRGDGAYCAGEWKQAREDLERATAVLRQSERSMHSAAPLYGLGQLCLAEGRYAEADELLGEVIALAERSGNLEQLRLAHAALAERELLAGDAAAARTRLAPLLDRTDQEEIQVTLFLPLLAWAYGELGEGDEAEALVRRAEERARAAGMRPALALALRVRALLAGRRDERQAAEHDLDEALAVSQAIGYPYLEAKAQWAGGSVSARLGQPAQARERLERARAILARLGERMYAEQVEQALAHLGQG